MSRGIPHYATLSGGVSSNVLDKLRMEGRLAKLLVVPISWYVSMQISADPRVVRNLLIDGSFSDRPRSRPPVGLGPEALILRRQQSI